MQRRWTIHKSACLICIIGLLVYCGPKQDEVDRHTEDGIEVVLNHLEPYPMGETMMLNNSKDSQIELSKLSSRQGRRLVK